MSCRRTFRSYGWWHQRRHPASWLPQWPALPSADIIIVDLIIISDVIRTWSRLMKSWPWITRWRAEKEEKVTMTATSSCPSLTGNDDKLRETHHGVPSDVTRVSRSVGVVMMMVSGQALVRAESRDQAQGSGGTRSTLLQPGSRRTTQQTTCYREREGWRENMYAFKYFKHLIGEILEVPKELLLLGFGPRRISASGIKKNQ